MFFNNFINFTNFDICYITSISMLNFFSFMIGLSLLFIFTQFFLVILLYFPFDISYIKHKFLLVLCLVICFSYYSFFLTFYYSNFINVFPVFLTFYFYICLYWLIRSKTFLTNKIPTTFHTHKFNGNFYEFIKFYSFLFEMFLFLTFILLYSSFFILILFFLDTFLMVTLKIFSIFISCFCCLSFILSDLLFTFLHNTPISLFFLYNNNASTIDTFRIGKEIYKMYQWSEKKDCWENIHFIDYLVAGGPITLIRPYKKKFKLPSPFLSSLVEETRFLIYVIYYFENDNFDLLKIKIGSTSEGFDRLRSYWSTSYGKQLNLARLYVLKDGYFNTEIEKKFAVLYLEKFLQTVIKDKYQPANSFISIKKTQLSEYLKSVDLAVDSFFGLPFKKIKGTNLYNAKVLFKLAMLKVKLKNKNI